MTYRAWTERSAGARVRTILALGICASVVAGLLHAGQLWVAVALGGFRWFSREFEWMAPVSYALVLLPAAAGLALVSIFAAHRAWLGFAVGSLTIGAVFGALLPLTQLSRTSSLLLAAGAGVMAARWAIAAPERCSVVATRGALVSLVFVPMVALTQAWWFGVRESRAVAALKAASPEAPNVLLVVLDAARAKSLGFINAAAGTTPRLDQWARGGVIFERAFAVAPWTLPSHASMMSGRYAGELSADWTVPVGRHHPVLAELFRDAGYLTGGFVSNLHYTAYDTRLNRGFVHYDDYQVDWPQISRSSSYLQTALADTLLRVPALGNLRAFLHPDLSIVRQHRYRSRLGAEVIDAFLDWESQRGGRPFFAFLNLMDPHLVTTAADEDRRRYPHDHRGEPDYVAAMRYLDGELDRLLATLETRGALERTVVIITADHGELLGEHGLEGHAQSAYKDVLHVPLFLRFPARAPGLTRIARAVSLRDLAATILDLSNVARGQLPGQSLAALWRDSSAVVSPAIAEVRRQTNPLGTYPTASGALSAVFDERSYYIRNHGTGGEELFDYATDTGETTDRAKGIDAAARLPPWRERLATFLGARR